MGVYFLTNEDDKSYIKSVNGVTPDENGNIQITMPDSGGNVDCILPVDFSGVTVHSVNHRGYSSVAPENTIPAYIMSKEKGFVCVEADVAFTSDGVAVLLHDSTIDRTSNGSGSISALTYAEVSKYDFGSWKSATYTGTRIPTFAEFITFCKNVGLHPYIELKNAATYTTAQIQSLVEMVNNCGMRGKVSWISFTPAYLGYVKDADPTARLGYLVNSINAANISTAKALQTGCNEVFMDSSDYDADAITLCQTAGLPLEIWTINSKSTIENMDSYITGVTSDNQIAENILREKAMNYEYGIDGVTLSSISATYNGGNVTVGTDVSALTGVVVMAHYSDGSTTTVTGYTLSGTIVEGTNTVTVSYGGKTTAFSVTGVAESGGGETDNMGKWVDGKFYFNLTQGGTSGIASDGYLNIKTNRVSYVGLDCTLTPGKSYKLIGLPGVRYGVQTITETGYAKIQSGSDIDNSFGIDRLDSGWKNNGYEFVADDAAVCVWLTASFASDDITPEQAMPVYLEEVKYATNITLSADSLSFTSADSQTLTATVEPFDTVDTVVWSTSASGVATVSDGIVTPVGNGTATIRVTAGSVSASCSVTVNINRTMLYNWDFTNSLVDTVNGAQATLIGAATQNANGLTITDLTSGANFGAIAKKGMTFEVDIAEGSTITDTSTNGRLLCLSASDGTGNDNGVVWRGNRGVWNTYLKGNTYSGWDSTEFSDDPTLFTGKTMTVIINDDGTMKIYSGSELVRHTQGAVNFDNNGYVSLGSVGTAAAGMVITAMRIYDGTIGIPQDTTGAWVDDTIMLDASMFVNYRIGKKYHVHEQAYGEASNARLSYMGTSVTLHSGYEYTVTYSAATSAIGKIGAQQFKNIETVRGKTEFINVDSGWQASGYTFTQYADDYDILWITLAASDETSAVTTDDLTSVTITRRKV